MRTGLALAAALLLATAPGLAGVARADGDPASDVLLGQDVFLPYSAVSPTLERRLYALTRAAHRAGYPLKIALIGAASDLGVIPALFGKPAVYARFLSAELNGVVSSPVLVVMPTGFGLATKGAPTSVSALNGVSIASGTDGLGAAAITATERLSAAAGHPLPVAAANPRTSAGADPATVRHATTAIAVLTALAALAIAAALQVRRRRTHLTRR